MDRLAFARRPGGHDPRVSDAGGERERAAERLADAEQVGRRVLVLAGEPAAGAAAAGVDLVEDEDDLALVA